MLDAAPERFVNALRVRLDPTKAANVHEVLEVRFDGESVRCALEVDDGVARFLPSGSPDPDVALSLSRTTWADLLAGRVTIAEAVRTGEVVSDRDVAVAQRFFSYFDHGPV